ncbi:hypothetical protein L0664_02460 [Octadecabacter sp. G9-8]|uniref:Glycerol-3-phosphate dehydrogenase n=1 Tax=Octadecabacter dasysiphoniae TaxID=2909341 RepID=A0ABS9CSU4_9RHOB|nr:hypothetical protein [Octadecabacter dasysiphoniae]MCF2869919.1 hypothetical protein [Octadecabacter dasysiphoniae]
MSDPVTNVEIEDVLSSIRRLVSDGDKARTRDPAPVEATDKAPQSEAEEAPESTPQNDLSDRLVLTPAFLVVDGDNEPRDADHAPQDDANDDGDDEWHEEDWPDQQPEPEAESDVDEAPLPLTEMVFEDVDDDPSPDDSAPSATDRSGLVATIAELEAAISAGDDDYEPDGSEAVSETIAWPGATARDVDAIEDADISDETEDDAVHDDENHEDAQQGVETTTSDHQDAEDVPTDADESAEQIDEYGDDDLDGLLEAGGATLDEEALRELVSEVVREELTGPLGERITRNVRKLVRREIYRILSSQEFD